MFTKIEKKSIFFYRVTRGSREMAFFWQKYPKILSKCRFSRKMLQTVWNFDTSCKNTFCLQKSKKNRFFFIGWPGVHEKWRFFGKNTPKYCQSADFREKCFKRFEILTQVVKTLFVYKNRKKWPWTPHIPLNEPKWWINRGEITKINANTCFKHIFKHQIHLCPTSLFFKIFIFHTTMMET